MLHQFIYRIITSNKKAHSGKSTQTINLNLSQLKLNLMTNLAQTTETNNTEKIETFLRSLRTEVEIMDYIQIEDIDYSDAYQSIYEMIDENGGFDIEIIYYSNAINYLKENDSSLHESIEIALEYGYELKSINSELLASLLAERNARDEFSELEKEINDFFSELETEEEEND